MLDVEVLQQMIALLEPLVVDEDTLAFGAMQRVAPGGHFFGDAHTMERYEHAFYEPLVSLWQNHEAWQQAGAPDAAVRATGIWKRALAEYQEPALEDYMARRRAAIGAADP